MNHLTLTLRLEDNVQNGIPLKENFKLSRGALSTTLLITVEEFFCGCFDGCIYTKKQYIVCDVKPPCILFMVLLLLLLSA